MKAIIGVACLALGIAYVINISRSEEALWLQRIEQMEQAGEEWEASQNIYKESLMLTQNR
jgi:hypothetical protein